MKALPDHVQPYRRTPTFDQDTVPAGLLRSHTTKAGVWARICVLEGKLRYRILTDPVHEHLLDPEHHGVVEPQVPHEIEPQGDVSFYVEFLKPGPT